MIDRAEKREEDRIQDELNKQEALSEEDYERMRQGFDEQEKESKIDNQGNPLDKEGKLITEKVNSIDDITDGDFTNPTRSIELPTLPPKVQNAIGTDGKPVIIKKNIFEKNKESHKDVTPADSREILKSALYDTKLYGQNQKATKPYNWVVINTKDENGLNRIVLLEVKDSKNNIEIVHWHYIDNKALETLKRQAKREDGQLLILPSDSEEAGVLSSRTDDLSSAGKDTTVSENKQKKGEKNDKDTLKEDRSAKNITESESKREGMLGVVLDALRKAIGKDNVITDSEEAQRIIDEQNGIVRPERVAEVNKRFNEELQQQIDGTLPKDHTYQLGNPSEILLSAGIPNLPIELLASRLSDKSMQSEHPFELSEIKDIVNAIHNPLVVFRSATHIGSNVILTELKHGKKSFVVAIETNRKQGKININSIRSIHYRTSLNIIGWLNNGLADYIKPTFNTEWLEPIKKELLSQPQYNSTDVRKQLNSVAKVLQNFENPAIIEQKNEKKS